MQTLTISAMLRNLRLQQHKVSARYGSHLSQHPDGVALLERSTALAWASLFSRITPCTPQQGA